MCRVAREGGYSNVGIERAKGMRDEVCNADELRTEDAHLLLGHSPRPQTEKDTTSTGSFAQAFLRKVVIPGEMGEESPLGAAAVTSNPFVLALLCKTALVTDAPLFWDGFPRRPRALLSLCYRSTHSSLELLETHETRSLYLLAAILVLEPTRARSSLGVVVPSLARGSAPWVAPFGVEVAE